ncbi:MAG: hypothetical protein ABL904_26620 [Hyphomicrobiaceae bacterium]
MIEYLLLMHGDEVREVRDDDWEPYLQKLKEGGHFRGGSAIGSGECARKSGALPEISMHLSGFIRIEAEGIFQARSLLAGNPVFEAGGTVEIRELPRTD